MRCPGCGKTAEIAALIETYGYRSRIECICGEIVVVRYPPETRPQYRIDYAALDALPPEVREAAIAYVEVPTIEHLPYGRGIDEHTPVWLWVNPERRER